MSADADFAEFVDLLQTLQTEFYIQFGLTALVVYEYLLTFQDEVRMIWRRKWTAATVLFMMNRYLLIASIILQALPSTPESWCTVIPRITDGAALLLLIVFALFSALRVYAMWDRNIFLFLLVILPNLVPVGTNFFAAVVFRPVLVGPPLGQCMLDDPVPPKTDEMLVHATRISVIIADALVLVLTWVKTFHTVREAARLKMKVDVTTMLLRDGTIYFFVLLAINIAIIATASTTASYISPFLTNLTPVLISRFMLNLRELGGGTPGSAPDADTSEGRFSQFSAPAFRVPSSALVGNLGADLEDFATSRSADESVAEDDSVVTPVDGDQTGPLGPAV